MGKRQDRTLRWQVVETTSRAESNIMQTSFANTDQSPKRENFMNITNQSTIGFALSAALLGAVTGCVGYVDQPHHARGYAQPPQVIYVESAPAVQDDYVYYPGYQVYYSGHTRQYVYQDGHSWVSRPAPPRVSVNVLAASPSVRLDFHDSPSIHHATVVKKYPKNWKPPGGSHGNRDVYDPERRDGN